MYTLHARFFCTFGTDLYAQSVLTNKISASELSRKFIKGPLLVGCDSVSQKNVKNKSFTNSAFTHTEEIIPEIRPPLLAGRKRNVRGSLST